MKSKGCNGFAFVLDYAKQKEKMDLEVDQDGNNFLLFVHFLFFYKRKIYIVFVFFGKKKKNFFFLVFFLFNFCSYSI